MLNPLKHYSALCEVPDDIAAVTDIGLEDQPSDAMVAAERVEKLWQRIVELYQSGIHPGLEVCVHVRGKRILNRALGYASGKSPGKKVAAEIARPMRVDTPTNLFSAAKAVTAMLVHKLDETGHLRIDDRVVDYLPAFGRHGKEAITLRHLLTHRAGIPTIPRELFQLELLTDEDALLKVLCDLKPAAPAGGPPAYHAISAGFVLGEVMRAATGQTPRDLMVKWIKKPLGLQWCDYGVGKNQIPLIPLNVNTGWTPRLIGAHLANAVGVPLDQAADMANDPRFLSSIVPAGNLISTAADMAVLYQCLMNDGIHKGKQVFERKTVQRAIAPDSANASIDRSLGIPMRYSAGFMLGHRGLSLYGLNRSNSFGHLGMTNTLTVALPEQETVYALITTGKPVLGPHLLSFPAAIRALNGIAVAD